MIFRTFINITTRIVITTINQTTFAILCTSKMCRRAWCDFLFTFAVATLNVATATGRSSFVGIIGVIFIHKFFFGLQHLCSDCCDQFIEIHLHTRNMSLRHNQTFCEMQFSILKPFSCSQDTREAGASKNLQRRARNSWFHPLSREFRLPRLQTLAVLFSTFGNKWNTTVRLPWCPLYRINNALHCLLSESKNPFYKFL